MVIFPFHAFQSELVGYGEMGRYLRVISFAKNEKVGDSRKSASGYSGPLPRSLESRPGVSLSTCNMDTSYDAMQHPLLIWTTLHRL